MNDNKIKMVCRDRIVFSCLCTPAIPMAVAMVTHFNEGDSFHEELLPVLAIRSSIVRTYYRNEADADAFGFPGDETKMEEHGWSFENEDQLTDAIVWDGDRLVTTDELSYGKGSAWAMLIGQLQEPPRREDPDVQAVFEMLRKDARASDQSKAQKS